MKLYAGFDGGGTRTTCVLCDPEGSVLGVGSGGPANFHNEGVEGALASLRAAFAGAVSASGHLGREARLEACLGLAGLDSPKDLSIMRRAVGSTDFGRRALVENDWRTAVAGAFVDEPGVVLIAGTGCVAAAQKGGRVVRVGGWGLVVDDRGSGYDIGREALYSAMRDYDGRGPRTALLGMIMRKLRVREPEGIIQRVYAERMPASEVASLSVLVGEAARSGDEVALSILREKGRVLGELVVSAASTVGLLRSRFGVALNGGVFKAGEPVLHPLEERVRASAPRARLVEQTLPPACGAVVMLMEKAGTRVDSRLVAKMRTSLSESGARIGPSG